MNIRVELFQRPKRASSISTLRVGGSLVGKSRGFNALNGLLPFLHNCVNGHGGVVYWFQRPKRASSISTAPSGNPHKHWLSSLIFAGICLNILTAAVFWKFFGTFTLCSYFYMSLLSLFS